MAYSKNRRLAEIISDTSGNLSVQGLVVPTQSSSDNDTSAASTAFVGTAITNLIDSAPGTLNTLNEIAAALNDDANFNTTVTNSIAAKLPLTGGTLTGNLKVDASFTVNGNVDTSASLGEVLQLSQTDSVGGFLWSVNRADGAYKNMAYHAANQKFYRDSSNITMTLASSGKVGIGETNPPNPLSISFATHGLYSQHRPSSGVGVGQEMYYKFNTANATPEIYSSIYTEIESNTDGAESGKIALRAAKAGTLTTGLILIGSTGHVGIGETDPDGELHVKGIGGGNGDIYVERTSGAKIHLQAQSANGKIGTISNHNLGLNTNATTRVTIDTNGFVGIGETSPSRKLHINGPDGTTNLVEGNSRTALFLDNAGATYINLASANDANAGLFFSDSDANNRGAILYEHANDALTFDTAAAEAMRIKSDGTVHIGAVDNNHVGLSLRHDGNDSYTPASFNNASLLRLNVPNVQGNYAGITYTHNGNTEYFTGLVRAGATSDITDFVFQGYNGNANVYQEYMRIDSAGRLLVARNSGYAKLSVTGNIEVTNPSNDLGTHSHSSYASAVNHGYIICQGGYSGTMSSGRKFVFKYDATSWKAFHGTVTLAATSGLSKYNFGGYWNNSGGAQVDGYNGAGATCAVTYSGQAVIVTLTLTTGLTHPVFTVEYFQSGGDGAPRMDRAEIHIQ